MSNSSLEQFNEQTNQIQEQINLFHKTPVQLSKINKTGRIFLYEGKSIQTSALRDLLNILSIKSDLLREIHDDERQWIPLQRCLADIKNDRVITGVTKRNNNEEVIIKFLREETQEKTSLNYDHGFDLTKKYLETAQENIYLHSLNFNEENLSLETVFRDLNQTIDVFGDQKDLWQKGFNFLYGLNKTLISPFLLRTICTNGLKATHQISQRYFNNKGLRQKSFNRLINKTLSEDIQKVTISSCDKMRHHNASLREFLQAREICQNVSKELADTYFNDEQIQGVYKPYQIRYKNSRWLSSANSNMNSYEFFNRLTHCVSHQTALPQNTGMQLNHLASEIFFKGPDLSFQAPNPFLS